MTDENAPQEAAEEQEPVSVDSKQMQTDAGVLADSRTHTRRSFGVGAIAAAAGYGLYRWIDRAPQVGRLQIPLRHMLNFNRDVARTVFDERGLSPEFPVARAVELRLNGTVGLDKQIDLASWRLQMAGVASASAHPRFTKDLTLYQYRYHGNLGDSQQAEDVKSAPGNGSDTKTGAKTPAAGSTGQALAEDGGDRPASQKQLTLAERFDAMNRAINHKRVRGDGEAGPSDSGLLDGTPGLLLTMDDLMKLPKVELVTEFKCVEGWSEIVHWGWRSAV